MSAPLTSGAALNPLLDRAVKRAAELIDLMVEMLLAGGPPFGTEKLSGYDLYLQLVTMRNTADPAYTNDPAAAATLARLEEIYGAVPPVAPPFASNLPPPPPQWQEGY